MLNGVCAAIKNENLPKKTQLVGVASLHTKFAATLGNFDEVGYIKIPGHTDFLTFSDVNAAEVREKLKYWTPNHLFVLGLRQILKDSVLMELDSRGCVVQGFHPAPLPQYPGASPIQHAILTGAKNWAVSSFFIEPGPVDSGRLIFKNSFQIPNGSNAKSLDDLVSEIILDQVLETIKSNFCLTAKEQVGFNAPPLPQIKRSEAWISPEYATTRIELLLRAFSAPYLPAFLVVEGKPIFVYDFEVTRNGKSYPVGSVVESTVTTMTMQCLEDLITFKFKP